LAIIRLSAIANTCLLSIIIYSMYHRNSDRTPEAPDSLGK
jgi:hypothetical protein